MKLYKILQTTMFNNGVFCRIDMPIRLIAVLDYVQYRRINELWWKMQCAKVWYWWGKFNLSPEDILCKVFNQKKRLIYSIASYKLDGRTSEPIILGKNGALIDGAHRLACSIYFNENDVPVVYDDRDGNLTEIEDVILKLLYNKRELDLINSFKLWIIERAKYER